MKIISLNGIWKMEGGGYNCNGEIPGSVYSFLLNNSLMENPHYRDNELEALKVLDNDFTFSRTFNITEFLNNKVLLRCDGLDTICDLFINGNLVGKGENMHRTYEYNITDYLVDGENTISITFYSPTKYIKEKYAQDKVIGVSNAMQGFSHIRKAHCMMGWDWGPFLPDAGIWRDIYVIIANTNRITDVDIRQLHSNNKVFLTPVIQTENSSGEISVVLTSPSGEKVSLANNETTEIINPQLWWPHGYGEQNLYTVSVNLYENGSISDSKTMRIGLRDMQLIREPDEYGISYCHQVNGVKIFAMGSNYIPANNIFSKITKDGIEKLLKCCIDGNFNTIRIWGGGYYPDDYFYDLCDELGLLIYHDLMFACMNVPDNKEMLENISIEVRQNLVRMRHHACIAVISGNNEIEEAVENWWHDANKINRKKSYIKIFEHLLPNIAKEVCPNIPYVTSSPTSFGSFLDIRNENIGDSHYYEVWGSGKPIKEYRNHYYRYLSEFAFQSYPSEKTIDTFLLPDEKNPFSRTMEMHQRRPGANKSIVSYLSDHFKYPTDFSLFIYATQLLQMYSVGYAIEHVRRNRGRCMGALYWQLNDIWPGISWSSIDYYGRYKALHYGVRRFFAPIMISCQETGETYTRSCVVDQQEVYNYSTEAKLNVTNETLNDIECTVKWQLRNNLSNIISEGNENIKVAKLSSYWLENLDFNKTSVTDNYFSYSAEVNGKIVSEGTVLFTAFKHFNFINPNLRYSISGDEITVSQIRLQNMWKLILLIATLSLVITILI